MEFNKFNTSTVVIFGGIIFLINIFVFQFLVTGGYSAAYNTTELVDLDGAVSGKKLPWNFSRHCIIMMNKSHSILVGGAGNPKQSLIVNLDTFEMTTGPNLTGRGRTDHACAHIRHYNGSNYVIAAGGGPDTDTLTTSEVLNVDNALNLWSPGK